MKNRHVSQGFLSNDTFSGETCQVSGKLTMGCLMCTYIYKSLLSYVCWLWTVRWVVGFVGVLYSTLHMTSRANRFDELCTTIHCRLFYLAAHSTMSALAGKQGNNLLWPHVDADGNARKTNDFQGFPLII